MKGTAECGAVEAYPFAVRKQQIVVLLCRYAAPMYCDVKHTVHIKGEDGPQETDEGEELDKVFLGEVGKST